MFQVSITYQNAPVDSKETHGSMMFPNLELARNFMVCFVEFAAKDGVYDFLDSCLAAEPIDLEHNDMVQKYGDTVGNNYWERFVNSRLPRLGVLEERLITANGYYEYRVGPSANAKEAGLRQEMPFLSIFIEKV